MPGLISIATMGLPSPDDGSLLIRPIRGALREIHATCVVCDGVLQGYHTQALNSGDSGA